MGGAFGVLLRVGDLLTAIGGRPLDDLAVTAFTQQMLALTDGQPVAIALEREGHRGLATVVAQVPDHDCVREGLRPLDEHVVARLGIIGVPVDAAIAPALPGLRSPSGVVVLWRLDQSAWPDLGLSRGDVIHGVNGARVASAAELRAAVGRLGPADPVVLQVEREGALTFLSAEARR
jgi:S1-C subfamily serine protease